MQQHQHQCPQTSTSVPNFEVKILREHWLICSAFLQQNYINQGTDYCLHAYLSEQTVIIEFARAAHYNLFVDRWAGICIIASGDDAKTYYNNKPG